MRRASRRLPKYITDAADRQAIEIIVRAHIHAYLLGAGQHPEAERTLAHASEYLRDRARYQETSNG